MLSKKICILYLCFLSGILSLKAQFTVNAGSSQQICPGTPVTLGGNPTATGGPNDTTLFTYQWFPASLVNSPTSPNPSATPTITTMYEVIVTDENKNPPQTQKSTVTIYVYPYSINAGPDTTIKEGQTITLHAQAPGDSAVYWPGNSSTMYNTNTLNPDVFPQTTTTYTLIAGFPHGCILYDSLKVTVIPNNELFFYTSFTPNGDGANDFFYIGNIGLYPNNTLDIFNRYGQKVFTKTGYNNDWNASYLGTDLPSGVYFYILDTHDTVGKFRGEVSVIR